MTTPTAHVVVRSSLIGRPASPRTFQGLSSVLVVACTTMAVAMTAFICVTTHLLN